MALKPILFTLSYAPSALEITVVNQSGDPIAGAKITVIETSQEALTDDLGIAHLPSITPGVYTFKTEKEGYTTLQKQTTVELA